MAGIASDEQVDRADVALARRARVVVVLASAWLFVLAVILPSMELGVGGLGALALAVAFPLAVAVGLALDMMARESFPSARRLALGVLLGLAPSALTGSLALRVELASRETLGVPHLTLLVIASALYLASAAWLGATHRPVRSARSSPLSPASLAVEGRWPRAARRTLLALGGLGALMLVAVAPTWSGHAARVARHGVEGADTGALLATVVGLAVGVTLLGAVVGPSLRARGSADVVPSRWRGAVWLGLAAISLLAWWLIQRG